MSQTGTHTLEDLRQIRNQTVLQFGLEAIQDAVNAELQAHNAQVTEMLALYATPTTERQEAQGYGSILNGIMEQVDDMGRVRTQRDDKPGKVGFPLRKYQFSIGFTAEFLQQAPVAEVATRALNAQKAHIARLWSDVRAALLRSSNVTTYYDSLVDNMQIDLFALWNGDGNVPQNGPNGETFDGTHSHYNTAAALNETALDALIVDVAEHNGAADVRVFINVAQESTVRGLTGFSPILDARIQPASTTTYATGSLNVGNRGNRDIGIYNGAVISVKAWVPAGYVVALDVNAPEKALRMRMPADAALQGLRQVAQIVTYPLQSQFWECRHGFAAKNRGAAAVLQITGGSYTDPV